MKAVYVREFGGAENLEIREVEDLPKPKGKEILVRVKTSALNRADILQRKGFYPSRAKLRKSAKRRAISKSAIEFSASPQAAHKPNFF
jgi:NADPH:quinone reductase-like Zn-dependent oxidoreductase